jgi:hypothetical protein
VSPVVPGNQANVVWLLKASVKEMENMKVNDRDKLIDFLKARLANYYKQVKLTGIADESETQYINGVMASIRILGFLEKADLKALVEAAHYQVFEMSYKKRKIAEALNDGGEHWDIFESPTVLRQHK